MGSNFDINKLNAFISQASQTILCDSECQKQREAENLKQIYLNSKTNLESAPNQMQQAQKNYVTFTEGEYAYNELLDEQLHEKAKTIVQTFNETFNKDSDKTTSQINTYEMLLLNYKNVVELCKKYKLENISLFKKLKQETNDILTNERKTYYEDQKIDGLNYFYFYLLIIIYIICVICFGFFSLKNYSRWNVAMFIGFMVLPFFSSRILKMIIYLMYELYTLLPKIHY
jgi:hypothetical protein